MIKTCFRSLLFLSSVSLGALAIPGTVRADLLLPNGDFEAYKNAVPGMPMADGLPPSWMESGVGGHTFIVDGSSEPNGFTALHGLPDGIDEDPQIPYAAQINGFGNGIYNSFASVAGQTYYFEFVFGVLAPGAVAEIEVSMFDGPDTSGLLLDSFKLVADPDVYGDSEATGFYIWGVTADSEWTTLLFTLDNSLGVGEDIMYLDHVNIQVQEVPEPVGPLCVVALAASVVVFHRRKRNTSSARS